MTMLGTCYLLGFMLLPFCLITLLVKLELGSTKDLPEVAWTFFYEVYENSRPPHGLSNLCFVEASGSAENYLSMRYKLLSCMVVSGFS